MLGIEIEPTMNDGVKRHYNVTSYLDGHNLLDNLEAYECEGLILPRESMEEKMLPLNALVLD